MTTKKKRIINAPNQRSEWGYDDIAWNKYDEAVVMPHVSLYDGKGTSVMIPELKKILKLGKVYKVKPQYTDKKLKAQLVAIYSDPIGFGDPKKKMPVRLATEWKFLEGNEYIKGRHETIYDADIEYKLRSKNRQKVEDMLWKKHGMSKGKALEELKQLIREKKVRF